MSDWKTRLKETIFFLSPDGNSFDAKWRGDVREMDKMIGEFSFPGRDGSIVQDLGSRAARYPLTIYFDGPDHDLQASAFFEAIKENGAWTVEHPVYDFIDLQPVRISETTNPVESGNITELVTEWIEPLDPITLETARQMWGTIDQLQKDLDAASGETFSDQVVTEEEE
jgi:prophage DNA circulation protein